ncbi:MAG: ribonuclease Z [archaeon]
MKIPITFLGTAQAIPTAKRNHTSILLSYGSEKILVDCGEGTQRQFRKAKLNPCKLTRILITHWHGDHILGLPGLLQTLALNNYNRTLHVYGPKGTKLRFNLIYKMFVFKEKVKVEIHEVSGKFLDTKDFYIEAEAMSHGTPCNAYTFIEKPKLRIDKSKVKKYKLQGKIISQLAQGKDITWQGKKIKASDLTYLQKGRKITFIMDTLMNPSALKIASNSDLLITESTFLANSENGEALAREHKHLTAKQAAEIAKKSKSKSLILSHLSQRYENNESAILQEAKKVFNNVKIAHDLMSIEI